ncbi:hypothetical protein OSTOST_11844 [Ostertagia ostertagi]
MPNQTPNSQMVNGFPPSRNVSASTPKVDSNGPSFAQYNGPSSAFKPYDTAFGQAAPIPPFPGPSLAGFTRSPNFVPLRIPLSSNRRLRVGLAQFTRTALPTLRLSDPIPPLHPGGFFVWAIVLLVSQSKVIRYAIHRAMKELSPVVVTTGSTHQTVVGSSAPAVYQNSSYNSNVLGPPNPPFPPSLASHSRSSTSTPMQSAPLQPPAPPDMRQVQQGFSQMSMNNQPAMPQHANPSWGGSHPLDPRLAAPQLTPDLMDLTAEEECHSVGIRG